MALATYSLGDDRYEWALAMQADKKSADGKVRTVCLEEIGRTTFVPLSAEEIVSRL